MLANNIFLRFCTRQSAAVRNLNRTSLAYYSDSPVDDKSSNESPNQEVKLGGFAQFFDKTEAQKTETLPPAETPQTFATLLRNSKFIDLGDPKGKVVDGKIFHVIENDLYIDFGWKFHCVCPRPRNNPESYVRGARVKLLIKDLELSSKFLGYDRDLTLLEADCMLLGLLQGKKSHTKQQ